VEGRVAVTLGVELGSSDYNPPQGGDVQEEQGGVDRRRTEGILLFQRDLARIFCASHGARARPELLPVKRCEKGGDAGIVAPFNRIVQCKAPAWAHEGALVNVARCHSTY